jgi:lipopolysaccharide/colanic/teichoic acid biosynthesis glycosyltransferase
MRRFFDVAASLIGVIVLSPLYLAIAAAVRLQDGGPALYRGTRVGKGGEVFLLYKFRSMVSGADGMGGGITVGGDQRITRLGYFLRRAKLDELPQLFNVLKGDMSLVGPRPEDPRYVDFYTPEQRLILTCRPGITSPASIAYRSEEELLTGDDSLDRYRCDVLPHKLSVDLEYLKTRTLWSDIKLIFRTLQRLRSWN